MCVLYLRNRSLEENSSCVFIMLIRLIRFYKQGKKVKESLHCYVVDFREATYTPKVLKKTTYFISVFFSGLFLHYYEVFRQNVQAAKLNLAVYMISCHSDHLFI